MRIKLFLLFLILVVLVLNINIIGERMMSKEKKTGATYLMDAKKDTLIVIGEGKGEKGSGEVSRIFFNSRDYTGLVRKLIKSTPLSYASSKILIFSMEKVEYRADVWKCKKGKVFIPEESKVIYIEATDIEYREEDQVLNGKNAKIGVNDLKGNLGKEEHFDEFSVDLGTYIIANKIIPRTMMETGNDGSIYYIDGQKSRLSIVEGKGEKDSGKIDKIYFNNKNYTRFVKGLISKKTLAFASSKLMIFSNEKVEFKSGKWQCSKGTVFIPGESGVMLLEAYGIIYDEEKQVLEIRDSKLKQMDLDGNIKQEQTLKNFSVELNEKE